MHCTRNTILPYECEWTCIASGYNVMKRKNELTKTQRRENRQYQSIELSCRKRLYVFVKIYKKTMMVWIFLFF